MAPVLMGLLAIALFGCPRASCDHKRDFPELPAHRREIFQQLATLRGASRVRRDASPRLTVREADPCGSGTSDQGALRQNTHQVSPASTPSLPMVPSGAFRYSLCGLFV